MERDCGAWINLLAHKVKRQINASLSELGITSVQSRVMYYILRHSQDGPVFQRDVENAFDFCRSTATGVLQLLERNGIIYRDSVDYDGRLKSLVPTEKAYQLDEQVRARMAQIEHLLTRDVSPEQLQVFLEVADQMSANLDAS